MDGTVWVIDDEPALRTLVRAILEDEALAVREFSGPEEALTALHDGARPTAILVDLRVGELSGADFCRAVVRMDVGVPCILLSAATDAARIAEELELMFVAKPFDIDVLVEAVRNPQRTAQAAS